MTWWGWFIAGVVIACFLWSWRFIAIRIAWASPYKSTTLDTDDIILGLAGGFAGALIFPIVIPAMWIREHKSDKLSRFVSERLLPKPPD